MTSPQIRVGDIRLQGATPTGQIRVGDVQLVAPTGPLVRVGDVRLAKPTAPTINYLLLTGDPVTAVPYPVTAAVSVTDPAGGPLAYSIDWGDGGPAAAGSLASVVYDPGAPSSAPVAGHTYTNPGTYTVTVTVSSPSGLTATATAEVDPTGPPLRRIFAQVTGAGTRPLLYLGVIRNGLLVPAQFDGVIEAGVPVDPDALIYGSTG